MADSTPSSFPGFTLGCEKLERFLGEGENRVQILRQVNLELSRGCIYAVTGPSGCGKSTLLYTLGLLDREDAGEIWINGTKVSGATDSERTIIRNRNIGFVFQFHQLLPEFSAYENVVLPAMIGKRKTKEMNNRADYLFNQLGVYDRRKHRPNELSGGEQQRIAVCRALINSPKIILADEPSGNLDSKNAEELHDLFFKLREELKQTFIIVTHNSELANMADRKLTLKDGNFI